MLGAAVAGDEVLAVRPNLQREAHVVVGADPVLAHAAWLCEEREVETFTSRPPTEGLTRRDQRASS